MKTIKIDSTGAQVIAAFKADVENFFETSADFKLRIEPGNNDIPACIFRNERALISIPKEMYDRKVETYEDLVHIVIILSHETSHYLHLHHEADSLNETNRSLEMWADYYGMKLALVALTYGESLENIQLKFENYFSNKIRIEAIASALSDISEKYFTVASPKYPGSNTRKSMYIAGMHSFFERYYQFNAVQKGDMDAFARSLDPELVYARAMENALIIKNNGKLKFTPEYSGKELSSELIKINAAIHRRIQGELPVLFEGMKSMPSIFLRLDYSMPENERSRIAAAKRKLFEETTMELFKNFK